MAKKRKYVFDPIKFTPLQGGAVSVSITKDAAPELYALAEKFPAALSTALFMLGGHTRKRMRSAIDAGGTTAHKWLGLSNMQRHLRGNRIIQYPPPRSYRDKKKLFEKPKGSAASDGLFGRVGRTLRFYKPRGKNIVEIGALDAWSARFLEAVQSGRRGSKGAFQYVGPIVVTPKIRRAMWAIGFPLSKHTKIIGQEPRPLISDIFKEMSPEFQSYILRRVKEILAQQGIRLE